jgi:hypothetical protein
MCCFGERGWLCIAGALGGGRVFQVCIIMASIFYYQVLYICENVINLQLLSTQILYVKAFKCVQ